MRPIPCVLETPYAGNVDRNEIYARHCMAVLLKKGWAPFASHLLYTQPGVLDDSNPDERKMGMEAGFAIGDALNCPAFVFTDFGVSSGMTEGINKALRRGSMVYYLSLEASGGAYRAFLAECHEKGVTID